MIIKKPLRARRNGFSLVELMVSTAVLSVVMLGAFSSHVVSRNGVRESREVSLASQQLRSVMDRLLLLTVDELIDPAGPFPIGAELDPGGPTLRDQVLVLSTPGYQPGEPAPPVLDLQLVLTWTTQRGRARTLTLSCSQH